MKLFYLKLGETVGKCHLCPALFCNIRNIDSLTIDVPSVEELLFSISWMKKQNKTMCKKEEKKKLSTIHASKPQPTKQHQQKEKKIPSCSGFKASVLFIIVVDASSYYACYGGVTYWGSTGFNLLKMGDISCSILIKNYHLESSLVFLIQSWKYAAGSQNPLLIVEIECIIFHLESVG